MTKALHFGYVLGIVLIGIGAGTSYAMCPDKLDQQLCIVLEQAKDTDWIGCLVGLKLQPPDSQVTDPTKDTTGHHTTNSPPAYLIAEVESLFSTYELRWPDTLSPYRLAPYPTKTRASVPSTILDNYGVFIRKRDVLSIGTKDYIGQVWAWLPDGPALVTPLLLQPAQSRTQGEFINLNGQRRNGSKFMSGPILKFKK
jgi:hypothetical protein